MIKLKLAKFKAFESDVTISLSDRKNLLLYGENGAGKSSIYEAVKIIFFRARLEAQIAAQTPEDLKQRQDDFWSSYNNKVTNQSFEIEINDTSYKTFDHSNYQAFLISIEDLAVENKITLKSLLEKFYLPIPDINALCASNHEKIQTAVNEALTSFLETVSIEIDEEDNYTIKVIDSKRKLERTLDVKAYFNEAKLKIIVILILINAIELSKAEGKSKLLVLDDFITSLDSSNRTFLIRYIFEKFKDTQIIILTHNISFYNLIMYILSDIEVAADKWVFCNLFEIAQIHKLYIKSEIERANKIRDDFGQLARPMNPVDIESIGNRIRKKFEILLYEYSKLLMIGAVEENKKILERITAGKPIYHNNTYTASDLVDQIERIINEENPPNLKSRIEQTIAGFKSSELQNLKKILKELKLYQKVTMHPMSHGTEGLPTFTVKEIEKSIELLLKLEGQLKELVDKNVAVV